MQPVTEVLDAIMATGLYKTPPEVLVTRWATLLLGEDCRFLDAMLEAGKEIEGSRYTFVAITDTAVCFLSALHSNEAWAYDPSSSDIDDITPAALTAWRRPITAVTEISLAGRPRDWLLLRERETPRLPRPRFVLRVGDAELQFPLPAQSRNAVSAPDATEALLALSQRVARG